MCMAVMGSTIAGIGAIMAAMIAMWWVGTGGMGMVVIVGQMAYGFWGSIDARMGGLKVGALGPSWD